MLKNLRKQAAKILMSFLFGMLILSFAIWGVGDIFRSTSRSTAVAEVGSEKIDVHTFSQYLTRDINRLQSQFGGRLDIDQIRALGIVQQLLHQLITGTLLDQQANRMGLVITSDQLRNYIMSQSMFHNEKGDFDRALYDHALQISNMSKTVYEEGVKRDLKRQELGDAVSGAVQVSRRFVDDFFRYRDEHRIGETITVPAGDGANLPAPDDATLQTVLTSHPKQFQEPERRSLTLIELRAADLLSEVRVTDEELKSEFEARRDEFAKPERRSLEQVLFDTKAEAESFKAAVDGGQDFDAAAKAAGRTPVDLSELSHDQIAAQMPGMADVVFGLKVGEVSAPIESPFGWHVVKLKKILPPYKPVFADQRDALRAEIAQRHAADSLVSMANQLDDELGGGATLEEAANHLGLKVTHIKGLRRDGTAAEGAKSDLLKSGEFLKAVFSATAGDTGLLTETKNGDYYVFRVDEVTPPAFRPLDQVRADVLTVWRREEARRQALTRAKALADKVRGGSDMAEIAREEGLSHGQTASLDRFGSDPNAAPPDLTAKLFGLAKDDVAVAAVPEGWDIVKLAEVKPGDPKANASAVNILADGLTKSLQNDALAAFTQELQRDIGVSINQRAIDDVLASY